MCNKKIFGKIFSRAYSALAHEDISTISKMFISWPSAVLMGGSVVAASQAFTALQLKLTDLKVAEMENRFTAVERKVGSLEEKIVTLEKKIVTLEKKIDDFSGKLDALLARSGSVAQ